MRWAYRGEVQGALETTVRTQLMMPERETARSVLLWDVSPILPHPPTGAPGVAYDNFKPIHFPEA